MRDARQAAFAAVLLLSATAHAGASDYSDPFAYGGAMGAEAGSYSTPPNARDWSGLYAGATLGYGGADAAGGDIDGFALGANLGHDWQFDSLLAGVEADLTYSGIGNDGLGNRYDVDWLGTVRGRIGYVFDHFVAYGTAGIAWASAEYAQGGVRQSKVHTGTALGLGLEARVWDNVSAKAEYLYLNLDERTYDAGSDVSIEPDIHLLRVGLNYRF